MTEPAVRRTLPPVHPFLLAIYPIALLFAVNAGEAETSDLVLPIAASLAATLLVFVVARIVLGSADRAAIATSIGVVLVFTFGYARQAGHHLLPSLVSANRLLLLWAVLLILGVAFAAFCAATLAGRINRALNVVAAILLAVAVLPLGLSAGESAVRGATSQGAAPSPSALTGDGSGTAIPAGSKRDIVYIVVEDMGRQDALEQVYGVDQAESVDWLRALGFSVADHAMTNYPKTALMLASALNMRYLDDVGKAMGTGSSDYHPVFRLIDDNEVARFLKSQGYRYVHIGSWWDPTGTSSIADENYGLESGADDFSTALFKTTVLPPATAVLKRVGVPIPEAETLSLDDQQYEGTLRGFDRLDRIEHRDQPTFTFAHILAPHPPFVFGADGHRLTDDERAAASGKQLFADQTRYTLSRVRDVVTRLLSWPEDVRPIVILQTDEGESCEGCKDPNAVTKTVNWHDASTSLLEFKLRIWSAFYLPGIPDATVPSDLTTVNTFRLVLSRYFGRDLPLLPNRILLIRDNKHPYDQVDATGRVQN
jgi:hypothetical protein